MVLFSRLWCCSGRKEDRGLVVEEEGRKMTMENSEKKDDSVKFFMVLE